VVDDSVAFCGGIDLTKNRWDTPEHRVNDPRRIDPEGKSYGPFHDIQMVVDGEAAATLGDLFRDRWFWANGQRLPKEKGAGNISWPQNAKPDFTDVEVAVARTLPPHKGREEVREAEALYRDTIKAAKHYIYMENQYLTSTAISSALGDSLKQAHGPEIVTILPKKSSGWLEQSSMDALRARVLKRLLDSDRHNRFRALYPALENEEDVYVHAKAMLVDDRLARVGSANLSNRSMGLDSECDLAVEAKEDAQAAEAIAGFRNRLLAEHLGTTPEAVDETMAEKKSLIRTIESLAESGRTLRRLNMEQKVPIDGVALVPDGALVDPERPIKLEQMIDQFVYEEDTPSQKSPLLKLAFLLLVLLGLAAVWRWTPLSEWVSMQKLADWADSLKGNPLSLLGVVGAYIAGGLLVVPVVLLVGATAMVFAPYVGTFYAFLGCLSSSLVTYGIGARLGKEAIRKIAGRRLNRLSKRLAKQGLLTVIIIRNLPIAPFTIVNMVAGASRIKFKDYLVGTALGMTPGILVITLFTDRLVRAVKEPGWGNVTIALGVAILLAIGFLWTKKRLSRKNGK
jgi:uncharacterized membrane protein YdjX (TVP38/TMEM64 family)